MTKSIVEERVQDSRLRLSSAPNRWGVGISWFLLFVALPYVIGGIAWWNRAMAQGPAVNIGRAGPSDPVVSVTGGQVRGSLLPQGSIAVFKGIPFAAPPVDDLRWREPQPVKPWQGIRDANAYGASCVQSNPSIVSKEDCLYLNVWAAGWSPSAKKPVLFWIHGGANVSGSASLPLYDGAALSRRDIVVVSINYRLGMLGFFAHPELTAESTHHVSGNYTLLDMLAALKWVHENIARFGGDPDNVTIAGQSSSGHDIAHLLFSPLTKGLFQRAIQESGVGSIPRPTLQKAEQQGTRFAASLKAPSGASQIKFLRSLPADVLQKAATSASSGDAPTVAPNVDGWFMPVSNGVAFAEGREQHVPLLIGSNSTEHPDMGALSLIAEAPPQLTGNLANEPASAALHDVRVAIVATFGINADKAMAYYGLANGGSGHTDPLYGPVTAQVSADIRYRCPVLTEAILHTSRNNTVYEYQFDRALPGQALTAHAAELAFVFGNLQQGRLSQPFTDEDRKVSDVVQTYWTNFIKTGNPNGAGLPAWQKFDAAERSYLEFTTDGRTVAKSGLRREICDLFIENVRHEMKLP